MIPFNTIVLFGLAFFGRGVQPLLAMRPGVNRMRMSVTRVNVIGGLRRRSRDDRRPDGNDARLLVEQSAARPFMTGQRRCAAGKDVLAGRIDGGNANLSAAWLQ